MQQLRHDANAVDPFGCCIGVRLIVQLVGLRLLDGPAGRLEANSCD